MLDRHFVSLPSHREIDGRHYVAPDPLRGEKKVEEMLILIKILGNFDTWIFISCH